MCIPQKVVGGRHRKDPGRSLLSQPKWVVLTATGLTRCSNFDLPSEMVSAGPNDLDT